MKRKILPFALILAVLSSQHSVGLAADLSVPFVYKTENGYTAVTKADDEGLNMYMGAYDSDGRLTDSAVGNDIGSEDGYFYYKTNLPARYDVDKVGALLYDKNMMPKTNACLYY